MYCYLAIIAGGSLMGFTDFSFDVFLSWMTPMGIDLSNYDIASQDIGAVVAGVVGAEEEGLMNISNTIAAIIAG